MRSYFLLTLGWIKGTDSVTYLGEFESKKKVESGFLRTVTSAESILTEKEVIEKGYKLPIYTKRIYTGSRRK